MTIASKGQTAAQVPRPRAADIANLHSTGEQGGCPAVVQAVVRVFDVRIGHTIGASGQGDIRLLGLHTDAEDAGDGQGHIVTGGHAGIGRGLARHDGFSIGAAAGQAAAAAVGPGQGIFDGYNLGIHVNVKNLGGKCQADPDHESKSAHEYYRYGHVNAPVNK
jgi:hypothetical protein